MKLVVLVIPLLYALTEAASILPVESSSSVNVKHSGQDYSYSIHENRGIAIDPLALAHHQIPIIKVAQGNKLMSNAAELGQDQVQEQETKPVHAQAHLKAVPIQAMAYSLPVAAIPAYNYLPNYGITYPYGINYPYNLVRAI